MQWLRTKTKPYQPFYKEQPNIVAINSPKTFDNELEEMSKRATIIKNFMEVIEIEQFISTIYQKLKGDAVIWSCYPKMTSKNYKCDFNRDSGWTSLGKYNLEPVRQVAIDDDFSALRFRIPQPERQKRGQHKKESNINQHFN